MSTAARLFRLVSLFTITAATFAVHSGRAAGAQPPPIPTLEAREAFIRAHQAGLAAETWGESLRGVHDEYDVASYDVAMRLDVTDRVIYGTVQVLAQALVANLSMIPLDLYTPMVVDGVRVDGVAASFSHSGGVIRVTLPHVLQPGETCTVAVDYHGHPTYSGTPFRWVTHGDGVPMILTYSEPYGAPAWWVCKDDPKDKATFAIHVTAPDTLVTVSNGFLTSVVQNGDGTATYNWTHAYPMSPYLFSIATTNFAKWTEVYTALDHVTTMNVDYYAYPEDLADAQISWGRNIGMMEYFAGLFGEYPFLTEKYAIAEFTHPGAMEHQTATSMGWAWITGTDANDSVVAHELSHSWVGDMITMRQWSHAWTKEGFATLCEALYFESLYGSSYYRDYMNSFNVLGYAAKQLYNINPPLDAAIYYKGAWVLHMLRHVVGEEAFFSGIRTYVENPAFRYGVSDTEGLRQSFEAASGRDLTWFFTEWIYSPGYPKYSLIWQSTPAMGGYDVRLDLTQTQTVGPTFRMPLDVRIGTDLGDVNFVVVDSLRTQTFTLHVAGTPQSLALDPDDWVIKEVQDVSDVVDAASLTGGPRLFVAPNPFDGATEIRFSLPERQPVVLQIYDIQGRRIRTLLDGMAEPGQQRVSWNGYSGDGSRVPSGIYLVRLQSSAGESVTKRIAMVRQ